MILFILGLLQTVQIDYQENNLLNGVIQYLQNSTNQTFLNRINVVTPTASSTSTKFSVENIFRHDSDSTQGYWRSENENDQWFQLFFHENAVLITDYIITAYEWDFLKEWEIYCSLDQNRWNQIDHVYLTDKPNNNRNKLSLPFHVKEPLICRYFKIVQKDENWSGVNSIFYLHKLEFFGVFYNYSSLRKMCHTCFNVIPIHYRSLFLFSFSFFLSS